MYRPRPLASVLMQDLGHSFSQYGPPSRQLTFYYFIYFYWNFRWLCLTRIRYYLLAGKMVKFRPLTKPLEINQITGFFLSCPLAHPKKKKNHHHHPLPVFHSSLWLEQCNGHCYKTGSLTNLFCNLGSLPCEKTAHLVWSLASLLMVDWYSAYGI